MQIRTMCAFFLYGLSKVVLPAFWVPLQTIELSLILSQMELGSNLAITNMSGLGIDSK